MPQLYPHVAVNNTADLFIYGNAITDGLFGAIIPFIAGLIIFIILLNTDVRKAALAGSFTTMVLCVFFRLLGIANDYFMLLSIVLVAISALGLYLSDRGV